MELKSHPGQRVAPNRAPAIFLAIALCLALIAAAPRSDATPEELIRLANAAYLRGNIDNGDIELADRLYAAAEEKTTDPGLVAFNRAAVLFQMGEFREAEFQYARVLGDQSCPPERAARAWYNRGTCLIRVAGLTPGGSANLYRWAISYLEQCLQSSAADEPLKADARHNLELAKILWNESRKTAARPESPNENPPPEESQSPPPKSSGSDPQPGNPEPGEGNAGGMSTTKPVPQPSSAPAGATNTNQTPAPGHAPNLQPVQDSSTPQQFTPEEARQHLKEAMKRVKENHRNLMNTIYGPERGIGHLDW